MSTLTKVTARTPDVVKLFALSDEAKKLYKDTLVPRQFFDALVAAGKFMDAVRFLGHALPKREAVWWACVCVRQTLGATPQPPVTAALAAAEKWTSDPSEDNRRAAEKASQAAQLSTPAGCAALAAFLSGGSLAPPNLPVVPPAEHLTGHAAASAILMAAVITEPEKASDKYKRFCQVGIDVGNGTNKWK